MVGVEHHPALPRVPGGLDDRFHQRAADAFSAEFLPHPKLEGLAHALPLEFQHHHTHNLLPPPGQQHPSAVRQEALRRGQHLQVHRLQQVVLQQPGQGDLFQLVLIAGIIVDDRKGIHVGQPSFILRLAYHRFPRAVNLSCFRIPATQVRFPGPPAPFIFNLHPAY